MHELHVATCGRAVAAPIASVHISHTHISNALSCIRTSARGAGHGCMHRSRAHSVSRSTSDGSTRRLNRRQPRARARVALAHGTSYASSAVLYHCTTHRVWRDSCERDDCRITGSAAGLLTWTWSHRLRWAARQRPTTAPRHIPSAAGRRAPRAAFPWQLRAKQPNRQAENPDRPAAATGLHGTAMVERPQDHKRLHLRTSIARARRRLHRRRLQRARPPPPPSETCTHAASRSRLRC